MISARTRPMRCGRLLLLALLAACSGRGDDEPLSCLLVTLDTTRADALSCYGAPAGATPHLDRLAAEGRLFEHAYATVPLTLPSHASMLTGLWPIRHGVRENGLMALPPAADTLAERARDAGYRTAAFVAARVLDASFGLDQGFATYDGPPRPRTQNTSHYAERPASEVIERALAWLDGLDGQRPFFLWVHLFDPHAPYAPPEELRRGSTLADLYLGEVRYADRELGRLLGRLREDGTLERCVVAVVGDHGEAFGEHGEVSHGPFCYDTTLRVPFLLRDPRDPEPGRREERAVSLVDLYPTLAEAMELVPPRDLDGTSLLRRRPPEDRGLYFESYAGYLSLGWSPLAGWRDPRGKYLHSSGPQLFDTRADPGEQHDLLAGPDPPDPRPYQLALAEVAELPRLEGTGAPVDGSTVEELRGLGYTTTGAPRAALPDPLAPSERPAPWTKVDEHRDTLAALRAFNAGDVAAALPVFARIAARNPDNWFVLDLYAIALMRQGRNEEAIGILRRLEEEGPERADSRLNLGVALRAVGRTDEAAEALRGAIAIDPHHPGALLALLGILEARGEGGGEECARLRELLRVATAEGGAE